ncbi:NmrA/HSCARG family protein [Roseibium alexandrii]|uniref:Putative nucleoside-diphosphate-sugar epimerase n=1 Tax=Roseibium alexandrii (strain DSM 17067 / NCIMB 14079 / DFL-11) TaxID=244592 RepID=A0A5E8GZB6_ROSAD|nr:NmrA/HSCARG family protein [Roseibium alexandrii]EEE45409.2 putative nucleoside-diphosphate-sugar epimerase [Roseibium alexandrii DFL-11]
MFSSPKVYDRPIVVTGATGKQGGAVAKHLLAHGHKVRALTRNPNKPAALALAESGAEIVKGDLEDRASLDVALSDAAGLYSVQDFLEAGVDAEERQGMNLIAAAAASNIDHVVYTGASTMDRNTGVPHLESKWTLEMAVRACGKPWTVFRPAAFMDNWEWERESIAKTGAIYYPMRPDMPYAQIACDDIGRMVALAFEQPGFWANKASPITGDISTMHEVAASLGRVMGQDVAYDQISYVEAGKAMGEELMLMFKSFDELGMDGSPYNLRQWLGDITDFETYLHTAGWGEN